MPGGNILWEGVGGGFPLKQNTCKHKNDNVAMWMCSCTVQSMTIAMTLGNVQLAWRGESRSEEREHF